MKMKNGSRLMMLVCVVLGVSLVLGFATHQSQAQDAATACGTTARTILDAVQSVCADIGRDQICYGNISVEASPSDLAVGFQFQQEGDIVNVGDIATLRLQTRSFDNLEWGVALAKLQATDDLGIPQDVTLLLFGNVEIENQGGAITEVPGTVSAASRINVRIGPSLGAGEVGEISPGDPIVATGIFTNELRERWIRIRFETAPGGLAWVLGDLLTIPDGVETLPVLESAAGSAFGPMQAFTFTSGDGVQGCGAEADSGLLIQTPAGVGEVNFLINEVDFQIGSSAFLQAIPGEGMRTTTLSGNVRTTWNGLTYSIPRGSQSNVMIDENGMPIGDMEMPQSIEVDDFEGLEIFVEEALLDEPFEVQSFDDACLNEYNTAFNSGEGLQGNVSGDCAAQYYDAFVDEFSEDLPAECFGEAGNVYDGCLAGLNELASEWCLDASDPFCDEINAEGGYYGDGQYDYYDNGYFDDGYGDAGYEESYGDDGYDGYDYGDDGYDGYDYGDDGYDGYDYGDDGYGDDGYGDDGYGDDGYGDDGYGDDGYGDDGYGDDGYGDDGYGDDGGEEYDG